MVRLDNEKGAITITDEVFANLAGDAATSCFGVKAMAARGKDGVFQLRRESMSRAWPPGSARTAASRWSCTSQWTTA